MPEPEAQLLAAVDLARAALLEITPPATVGDPVGHVAEGERTLSLLFEAKLSGYPGWHWTVTVASVEGEEPTVLEAELQPGEHALLAPEWVPWSERLADYRAAAEAAQAAGNADENEGSDTDDIDPDDIDPDDIDPDEGDDYDYDDDVDVDVFGDEDAAEQDEEASDEDAVELDDEASDEEAAPELAAPEPDSAAAALDQHDDEADDAEHDADDAGGQQPAGSGDEGDDQRH